MKTVAQCKSVAELNRVSGLVFRKPSSFEFSVNEYGEPVKYVLDCGEFQSNSKFYSLADCKEYAEKFGMMNERC